MKITVFGTGIVGKVIAARLADVGHSVSVGTRDVAKTLASSNKDAYGNPPFADWYKQHSAKIKLVTFEEGAGSAEVLFNCTLGQGSVDALKQAGIGDIKGKVLIDISNPLDFSKGMPPILSPGNTDSLGEMIQRTFPDLKVVKTLNTMNCYLMANPALVPGDHTVFVSGNDQGAKDLTKGILQSFGWTESNIMDLGDITTARGTEQLLPLWLRVWGAIQNPMFNFNVVVAPAS